MEPQTLPSCRYLDGFTSSGFVRVVCLLLTSGFYFNDMTYQKALEIKTKEITKSGYKCFDDLLHTHSHKGWLLEVVQEAAELYAKTAYDIGYQDAKKYIKWKKQD